MAFPGTEIERKDATKGAAPASTATPRLECVVDPGPPPTHPTAEHTTDSAEIEEKGIFLQSAQGLKFVLHAAVI